MFFTSKSDLKSHPKSNIEYEAKHKGEHKLNIFKKALKQVKSLKFGFLHPPKLLIEDIPNADVEFVISKNIMNQILNQLLEEPIHIPLDALKENYFVIKQAEINTIKEGNIIEINVLEAFLKCKLKFLKLGLTFKVAKIDLQIKIEKKMHQTFYLTISAFIKDLDIQNIPRKLEKLIGGSVPIIEPLFEKEISSFFTFEKDISFLEETKFLTIAPKDIQLLVTNKGLHLKILYT